MKKFIFSLLLLLTFSILLGDNNEIIKKNNDKAYIGIIPVDLSSKNIANLNYSENYGILITRVIDGTPAYKANLKSNDIIMKINDEKVYNNDELSNILETLSPGDETIFTIFRQEKIITVPLTLGKINTFTKSTSKFSKINRRRKKYSDFFSIGWVPMFFIPENMNDINTIVTQGGFQEFSDDFLFLNGFSFHFRISEKYSISGIFLNKEINKKTSIKDDNFIRTMNFNINFKGIILDRNFINNKYLSLDVGAMLGNGEYSIKLYQTDGIYNWDDIDENLTNSNNNFMNIKKSYFIFQPHISTVVKLTHWLGIKTFAGYNITYSPDEGWINLISDKKESFEIKNSPNTSFNGLTLSIGPWITF